MQMKRCVVIIITIMMLSSSVWAGDTDPSGTRLRAVVEKYMETASPSDENANKLRASNDWESGAYIALCTVEMISLVGLDIWMARVNADNYPPVKNWNALHYCSEYSRLFDHWHWNPDSFKNYRGKLKN